MTGEEPCELSDLPADQCGCHRHRGAPDPEERMIAPARRVEAYRYRGTIRARFDTECPGCGEPITRGDPIHLSADDDWVCGDCDR